MTKPVKYIADHLRQVLIDGASAPHTIEVQRFFKEEIQSRGWYSDELRKVARRFSKTIKSETGLTYLVDVADNLFHGDVLEEKVLAVFLLETSVKEFSDKDFSRFTDWIDRICSWADHDALMNYVIGPILVRYPKLTRQTLAWADSADRWHRRAAAVSLIRGGRVKAFEPEIRKATELLCTDQDDMVQKGLGWLLREAVKYNPEFAIPYVTKIRAKLPRFVLRTACETLSPKAREQVMGKPVKRKVLSRRALSKK